MNKICAPVTLLLAVLLFASCSSTGSRPDTYPAKGQTEKNINPQSLTGSAVITEILNAKNSAGGYLEIYFSFIPADPGDAEKYTCPGCPDKRVRLFYDNRDSFLKNWVGKWDIKAGNQYPAIRHEFMRNDGTPAVSYEVLLDPKK